VQKFPSLPHVDDEVKEIQALHGGTILRNQSFLVERFSSELRDKTYSVVHVASHGQFETEARRSFLLAYDGRVTMDNLERLLRLSRFRDEPVELLTLSACRTAAENDRSALGLAGVAVKAGVRSALATLWYVNDQATGYLMADFYRHLAEASGTKAKALQAAQLRMLGERRFRHPGYWSPFLLVGNWL
jgi:CHAT domain-containing protein